MKYDDASWHDGSEGDAAHIGLFFLWALSAGLAVPDLSDGEWQRLHQGTLLPSQVLAQRTDGKLTEDDLTGEGNAFAAAYYTGNGAPGRDGSIAPYLDDYEMYVLSIVVASGMGSADSMLAYGSLKSILDDRLAGWRAVANPASIKPSAWKPPMSVDAFMAIETEVMPEHIFAWARQPSPALADIVEAGARAAKWHVPPSDLPPGELAISMHLWANTLVAYCRAGLKGLAELARDPAMQPFVASFINELPDEPGLTTPAFTLLVDMHLPVLLKRPVDLELLRRALDEVGGFTMSRRQHLDAPQPVAAVRDAVASLLALDPELPDVHQGIAMLVLGYVGNAESLALLERLSDPPYPWHECRIIAIKQLRERLSL